MPHALFEKASELANEGETAAGRARCTKTAKDTRRIAPRMADSNRREWRMGCFLQVFVQKAMNEKDDATYLAD
jgi:hypothetical protein